MTFRSTRLLVVLVVGSFLTSQLVFAQAPDASTPQASPSTPAPTTGEKPAGAKTKAKKSKKAAVAAADGEQRVRIRVTLGAQASQKPVSGRLLVMMTSSTKAMKQVILGFENIDAKNVWASAKEIHGLAPGGSVDMDPDDLSYPTPFSKVAAGDYQLQAYLDTNHDFSYYMEPNAGDLESEIMHAKLGTGTPVTLTLSKTIPEQRLPAPHAKLLEFRSEKLSAYWGRPMMIRGWVVLPPSYEIDSSARYPVVYVTHGFGGDLPRIAHLAKEYSDAMQSKKVPEMIYVVLEESCPRGTHEFADSANNGPYGYALTEELIPEIDRTYRTDGKAGSRFVTGHSSGGWAALWLQVAYPKVFGGSWPTAPDPSDFHSFTGVDLTKDTNFYHRPDGSPRMLVRMGGKDVLSLEQFAKLERVMGDYGGQMASFEYVFSPRGEDGRPQQLFDRDTGEINRNVALALEKYDVAKILRDHWKELAPDLDGKIHLTVGTADTFNLDEPARLLEQTLKELGAKAEFTYAPNRTHMNLYEGGLQERMAKEMYAVARPTAAASK